MRSGRFPWRLIVVEFCFALILTGVQAAPQTFNFANLGTADTGGTGFKTVGGNPNILVSNTLAQAGVTGAFLDTGAAESVTFVFKASDSTVESFDIIDMRIGVAYPENPVDFASTSKISFKDKNGTTVRTMSLTNRTTLSSTSTSVGSVFDISNSFPVSGVATIEFSLDLGVGGTSFGFLSEFMLLDVTLDNIVAPGSGNAAPVDIALSGATLNQSAGANATVGTLTTTDADSGDTHTYSLVSGDGDTDNGSFNVDGSTLRATTPLSIAAGVRTVRIQTSDGKGGTYAEDFTITVTDDVAPAAPSTPDLDALSDSGSSNTDNITQDTTPTFTGTAEAGATVTLYGTDGTTVLGTATATGGNWTITSSLLSQGSHTVTAKAKDAADNVSVASSGLTITIDTTAPVFTSSSSVSLTYGVTPTHTLTASGDPVRYAVQTSLPAGLTLNTATGALEGAATSRTTTGPYIVAAFDAAGNQVGAVLSFTIAAKPLTITGVTASDKTYDGNTTATLTGTSALLGVVNGDDVAVDGASVTGTFASASVGSGLTVTTAGYSLTGTTAVNYSLTQPTTTASITAKELTVTGITAADKTYDATTTATLDASGATLVGIVGSDDVTPVTTGITGTFFSKTVNPGKIVTITGVTLGGAAAGNYSVTQPSTTASITAKPLTVTGITAANKPYDDTTTATIDTTSAALVGIETNDTVTLDTHAATGAFADAAKGTGKTVTVSGLALTGADAGNYSVTPPTTTADITGKQLTVTGITASNKPYDGTAPATLDTTGATLVGVENGDTVTLNASLAAGTFADALPATGKAVTVTGLTISGADAPNYDLVSPTPTADITAVALTVTGVTAAEKPYDATTTATLDFTNAALVGIVGSDTVTLDSSAAAGAFADKAIGTAKPVTITGLTLAGANAAGYTVTAPTPTAAIAARDLPVTGVTVADKPYDGTTVATADYQAATLVGIQGLDTVTLDSHAATAAFATADAGTAKAVTLTGLVLAGADAGNYTLTVPEPTATITPLTVTFALGDLAATYDGTAHAASVTATPTGVAATLTYNGSGTAPTAAGSYVVVATSADPNYTGTASGTLVIGQASQTVAFPGPGTVTVRAPVTLNATASSGLPVTYQVISGDATLAGATLTINSAASAVGLRATQAGDTNYTAASADLTIGLGSIAKLTQTITFPALAEKRVNDAAFDLTATASSGLAVTYTVVSGPAMLSGNTVTLTGATGTVVIRADQAGNDVYAAATSVSQSFEVTQAGPLIYFGTATDGTEFAVSIPEGSSTGTLFGEVGNGQFYILTFQVNADRTITPLFVQLLGEPTSSAAALTRTPLRSLVGKDSTLTGRTGAAELALTFTGTIQNGVLTFTIAETGQTLNGTIEPATGPTASIAGLYESSSLNSANGSTNSIVGTSGKVYVLAITPNVVTAQSGTVAADGSFALTTPDGVIIQGNVDAPSTTVTGTIILPDGTEEDFAGLSTGTLRTDRLINLSTRARVSAGGGTGNLIAGFVIGGSNPKEVLIRGIGPGLAAYGITDALADPKLRLYDASGTLLRENDNWGGAAALTAAMNRTGGFPLPANSPDAAILATLAPGAYTVHVVNAGEPGVALAEIYDAAENPNSEYQRLINISSRGTVSGGDGVLIGGFIVTGNSPKRVLVRGVGPGLGAYGVEGTLTDPTLKLYGSNGVLLAQNDNWQTPVTVAGGQVAATAAEITTANAGTGAFQLAGGGTDAAVVVTLAPGAYTAHVGSASAAPGTALIEVYEIP